MARESLMEGTYHVWLFLPLSSQMCDPDIQQRGRSSTFVAYSDNCHRTPDVADSSLTPHPFFQSHHTSVIITWLCNQFTPKNLPDKFLCLLVRDSCLWRDLLEFRPHGVFVGEDADNVFMCSVNRMCDMWNLESHFEENLPCEQFILHAASEMPHYPQMTFLSSLWL